MIFGDANGDDDNVAMAEDADRKISHKVLTFREFHLLY